MRAFIAVQPTAEHRARVAELMERMRPWCGRTKWVEEHNLHLTLCFLGDVVVATKSPGQHRSEPRPPRREGGELEDDVDTGLVSALGQVLHSAAAQSAPFRLGLASIGAFPSLRQAQTLWVGVTAGLHALRQLHQSIEAGLAPLGFKAEVRPYTPHLTLGRRREDGDLRSTLQPLLDVDLGEGDIATVSLMQSQLGKQGPVYTQVAVARLGGNI